MHDEYWQRQSNAKPLFEQLLWSRPENRQFAGKLLIVGGNAHEFAAPAEAYAAAAKAGIGTARVLLPDVVQKILGRIIENGEFAPSTPSGSFAQRALGETLSAAGWADGILLAGDLGRNSETAILIEKLLASWHGQITLAKDAVDYATSAPLSVLHRSSTLLVLSFSQLQRLAVAAKFARPLTFGMDVLRLVDWLHTFSTTFAPWIITKHLNQIFVAGQGQVSSTKLAAELPIWRVQTAAYASVWWLQQPGKSFEALTTAVHQATVNQPPAGDR